MPDAQPPSALPTLVRDWLAYYQAVSGRPPRPTLLQALERFAGEGVTTGRAVDLGCGDGRDTVPLLEQGWQVLAVDGEAQALALLQDRLATLANVAPDRLTCQQQRFETLELPTGIDLINASFCLPFCPPPAFPQLWQTLTQALRPGGRFCGQLFGNRDSWASDPAITHHTAEELQALLTPFVVELLDEEEHPGTTALGESKDWHLYHLVLRKL